MRKKLHLCLYIPIVSFLPFYLLNAPAMAESNTVLRSTYRDLIVFQVQSLPNIYIVNKHDYGFYGHSTINHSYEKKMINGEPVVIDSATGLIWHQSGSLEEMDWNNARQWVKDFNKKGYAGYNDWRLPTVEEAASLLEKKINESDMYIANVFDTKQTGIWTGDENDSASYLEGAWSVRFTGGYGGGNACWLYDNAVNYVRPVRSMNKVSE